MITVNEAIRSQLDFLRYCRRWIGLNNPAYARLTRDIGIMKMRLRDGIKRKEIR